VYRRLKALEKEAEKFQQESQSRERNF